MARVGILGGTFDPPHNGHIAIANAALGELGLDKVIFIPVGIPPHKPRQIMASSDDRIQMLRRAIENYPQFEISRIEIDRPGPSYTADTLEQLHSLFSGTELVLIIGADNILEIEGWHEPDRIFGLATIAAANRPGFAPDGKYVNRVTYFNMPPAKISSTLVRERIKAGKSIAGLVPAGVGDYIANNGLYK